MNDAIFAYSFVALIATVGFIYFKIEYYRNSKNK